MRPDRRPHHEAGRLSFARLKDVLAFTPVRTVDDGIDEIFRHLKAAEAGHPDPTCYTTEWYLSLMEWEQRLNKIRLDDSVLG